MLVKVTASAAKENAGQSGALRRWVEKDLWDFTICPDIHDTQCTGVAAVHGVDMVGSK